MPPKLQDAGRFPSARIKRIMQVLGYSSDSFPFLAFARYWLQPSDDETCSSEQVDPDVGQIAKDTPPVISAVLEQCLLQRFVLLLSPLTSHIHRGTRYLKELVSAAALVSKGPYATVP